MFTFPWTLNSVTIGLSYLTPICHWLTVENDTSEAAHSIFGWISLLESSLLGRTTQPASLTSTSQQQEAVPHTSLSLKIFRYQGHVISPKRLIWSLLWCPQTFPMKNSTHFPHYTSLYHKDIVHFISLFVTETLIETVGFKEGSTLLGWWMPYVQPSTWQILLSAYMNSRLRAWMW